MAKNIDMNSSSNNLVKIIITVVVIIAIIGGLYYLYNRMYIKPKTVDNFIPTEENNNMRRIVSQEDVKSSISNINSGMGQNSNNNEYKMESFSTDQSASTERNESSFPKDQLSADELLPQDNSSLWAQVNPSGEGSLKDRNFLQSGYHIGINTVGQTLRNANLQLRSEPPCPQVKISPWMQSTISPDVDRKPFEIGGCA